VTQPNADESPETGKLLDFWMGGLRLDSGPPGGRSSAFIWVTAAAAILVILLLARYAADILLLLVPIGAALVALHLTLQALMRSTLLSTGWVVAAVLVMGLGAWIFVPNDFLNDEPWIPKSVMRVLEWSQARGWGHTAMMTERPPRTATGSGAESSEGGIALPGMNASIQVTVSQPSSAPGDRVTLTAQVGGDADLSSAPLTVRFFDGAIELGAAPVQTEWGVRVAHLAVTTLGAGSHEISAEMVGASGAGGGRSAPVRHLVVATPGRRPGPP
jgi:hypothetical protein